MLFLEFGDIFWYENKEYVYLANIDSILYGALIISPPLARQLINKREDSVRRIGVADTSAQPIYCFVELRTLGYEDRVASLARTDESKDEGLCLHGPDDKLCRDDMVELKEAITNGNLPKVLKEHFETIEIADED